MTDFHIATAALFLIGMVVLAWQYTSQGTRGSLTPVIKLGVFAFGNLLLTPPFEAALAHVRVNAAYLVSDLCGLIAAAMTVLHWGDRLREPARRRRRLLTTTAVFGFVVLLLLFLFATSPQQRGGVGFRAGLAGHHRMQLFWIVQSIVMVYAMATFAGVVARARARESRWRRMVLSALSGVAVLFAGYAIWLAVVVLRWPTAPPGWAANVTDLFQVAGTGLLAVGTIGPAVSGALHSTRVAMSYLEELAPLHSWLLERYPQVRFRADRRYRAETRVTDMLIEVSDALRLLQHDIPAVASDHGLDDGTIRAHTDGSSRCAAYEMSAARLFASRHPHGEKPPRRLAYRWIVTGRSTGPAVARPAATTDRP